MDIFNKILAIEEKCVYLRQFMRCVAIPLGSRRTSGQATARWTKTCGLVY